jgi:ABC-type phosphate transport system substrate-binding protein
MNGVRARRPVLAFLGTGALLSACGQSGSSTNTGSGLSGKLTIAGSSALQPLVDQASKNYQSANKQVQITASAGGSGQRLWGYLRDHVTRNDFWGTFGRGCAAVIEFLRALDLPTFQRLMSTSPCMA